MFGFGKGASERTAKRMRGSSPSGKPDPEKEKELREKLKQMKLVPREVRVAEWCTAVTRALLDQPDNLKGVMYRCQDNVYVGVHRFIFGLQSMCAAACATDTYTLGCELFQFAFCSL